MDKEDVVHIYDGNISHKKNEIMLFAATWMDLTKWRKSDTERQMESKRTVQMNLFISKELQMLKQAYGYQGIRQGER